ncbi:hypothetical protein ACRPOS_000705 [Bartonella heixiaziensis]|uniref:hypothetical protein n=1 Tax=Bartonella heixiaziensis TaxID=1461000 RepID=UPI0039088BB0
MKMIYFITAYATFASISVAQSASFIVAQKLVEGVSSSKSLLSDAHTQIGNPLGEPFRTKFSPIINNQQGQAAQLVPVTYRAEKGRKSCRGKGRPKLFWRSPMSFK